jgi:HAD superfamily hydrolase (TIGR01509 family)
MSIEECVQQFLGRLVRDNAKVIEQHIQKPIDQAWMDTFLARRDAALQARLSAIDGVETALGEISRVYGEKIACASGADRRKIELQLNKVGLMHFFVGRCFSGFEMAYSKPAPDVYLAAASALGVEAKACAVVEDSATGVRAGVAAGASVFAFVDAHSHSVQATGGAEKVAQSLLDLGACATFSKMRQLPELLMRAT